MPQWVSRADNTISGLHLERLFLGRHKFNHYRVWYRDALSTYLRQTMLNDRALSRPHVNRTGVERVVNGHLGGGLNYTTELHQLLTLELIHQTFVDAN
jgi:asparagine synthase (glutamine-hydrolysing)